MKKWIIGICLLLVFALVATVTGISVMTLRQRGEQVHFYIASLDATQGVTKESYFAHFKSALNSNKESDKTFVQSVKQTYNLSDEAFADMANKPDDYRQFVVRLLIVNDSKFDLQNLQFVVETQDGIWMETAPGEEQAERVSSSGEHTKMVTLLIHSKDLDAAAQEQRIKDFIKSIEFKFVLPEYMEEKNVLKRQVYRMFSSGDALPETYTAPPITTEETTEPENTTLPNITTITAKATN